MPPVPPPTPPPTPPPRPRPYVLRVPIVYYRENQNCRPVYHNQRTIDGLNAMLAGCDKLRIGANVMCSRDLVNRVERALARELSIAVHIGTSCANPTIY